MRILTRQALFAACLGLSSFFSSMAHANETIPDATLTQDIRLLAQNEMTPELMQTVCSGQAPHLAIACPAGVTLPVSFELKGNILTVEPTAKPQYVIKTHRDIFIRFTPNGALLSLDMVRWASPEQILKGKSNVTFGPEGFFFEATLEV